MSVLDTPDKRLGGTVPVEFEENAPNCPQCGSWHTGIFRNPNIPHRFACVECDTVFTGLTGPEAKSHVSHDSGDESHRDTDDRDLTPYVRYASHPTEQAPELTPVDDPIPEDARFASPIYLLTEHQAERQADLDEPHAAKGDGCIAKALQDECENRNDVRYPVYVESDDLDTDGVSYADVRDTIAAFIRDEIGVDPDDCRWFYSGGRSIHAHVPIVVRRGTDLSELRQAAQEFNADSDHPADVDPGLYTRKRQFRLPGVEHGTTGGVKTPIDHRADDLTHELMDAMTRADGSKPDTFDDVLGMTFDVGDDGASYSNSSSCNVGERRRIMRPAARALT